MRGEGSHDVRVVASEGGLIQYVSVKEDLKSAERDARSMARTMDPETDDVVVWDLDEDSKVYQPLKK